MKIRAQNRAGKLTFKENGDSFGAVENSAKSLYLSKTLQEISFFHRMTSTFNNQSCFSVVNLVAAKIRG